MTTNVVLETSGLTRRFGDTLAVDALSLRVREGEIYGFLGPNGAGKTTSIRMIAGLLKATSGRVLIQGREVGVEDADARRLVGLCPQENVVYPELTARENLEYAAALFGVPRRERRGRAEAILTKLGLAEKAKARASDLSGGMKRRLTLGLALVHDPPVVVLDEPEAGLDPQTRVAVREVIHELAESKTIVLTSHNMDEVERLADRVGIIDHGRLVAEGTPSELKSKLGATDVVDITLASGEAARVMDALKDASGDVSREGSVVTLRGRDLARRLPDLMARAAAAGGGVADLRYRGATLEDVFIALTGRGLRE